MGTARPAHILSMTRLQYVSAPIYGFCTDETNEVERWRFRGAARQILSLNRASFSTSRLYAKLPRPGSCFYIKHTVVLIFSTNSQQEREYLNQCQTVCVWSGEWTQMPSNSVSNLF